MRTQYNEHRLDKEFRVGDLVYLKLQPYRQGSVSFKKHIKLAPRFYGPYKIIRRIGNFAYKLELPPSIFPRVLFEATSG